MKKTKFIRLLTIILTLVMCASVFAACNKDKTPEVDTRDAKYTEAYELLAARDYEAAYALFVELGDYKDAAKEAAKFRYVFDGFTETYGMPDEMDTETAVITYNEDNLPIKCEKTYLDGAVYTSTFQYDANGRLISVESISTEDYRAKFEWTYDANGNMLTYSIDYGDGELYTEARTYDENGNNITIEAHGTGGYYESTYEGGKYYAFYEMFYDENGNNNRFVAVDGDETIEGELWHNEDGVLTRYLATVKRGDEVSIEEELYDENGNRIKKTVTKDGEVILDITSTYDENGNLVTDVYKSKEEEGEYSFTETYTYDAKGNAIKMESVDNDGYTSVRDVTFRFVYVPYEYSEAEWDNMIDRLYFW